MEGWEAVVAIDMIVVNGGGFFSVPTEVVARSRLSRPSPTEGGCTAGADTLVSGGSGGEGITFVECNGTGLVLEHVRGCEIM